VKSPWRQVSIISNRLILPDFGDGVFDFTGDGVFDFTVLFFGDFFLSH